MKKKGPQTLSEPERRRQQWRKNNNARKIKLNEIKLAIKSRQTEQNQVQNDKSNFWPVKANRWDF